MKKLSVQNIALVGILAACSLIIFVIEMQFPSAPVGGIKLGLANVVTLVAMMLVGRMEAGLVLLIRILLATAFYGTFVSFAFSLAGGALAYIAMCITINRFDRRQLWVVSVLGALSHNAGQLLVAAVITGTWSVLTLLSYLIISGIITGFFTGIVAQRLWFSPLQRFSITQNCNQVKTDNK